MSNHLHLLVQISDLPLGVFMQRIAMRYARYRHCALHTTGHLFERRYGAKLIDDDPQFLATLCYIHINPVAAGITPDATNYPWSSHQTYLGTRNIPWLTTDLGLSLFHWEIGQARSAYAAFMTRTDANSIVVDAFNPRRAGHFANDGQIVPGRIRHAQSVATETIDELARDICRKHNTTIALLRSPARTRVLVPARIEFAVQTLQRGIANLIGVARYLNRTPAAVTQLLGRHERTGRNGTS